MCAVESFYLDRPLVIAHRGARDVAPENTLAAFMAALDAGADGIELDVSRCATGEIVVMHDDTLDRTTDGHGPLATLPFWALRELDAGGWFDPRFQGELVPLLDEALDLALGRLRVNIEIKARAGKRDGIEAEIAEMVRTRGMQGDVIISSFDPGALVRMRRAAPELMCALLYSRRTSWSGLSPWLAQRLWRADALHPELACVSSGFMARARARDLRVNVWTVNAEADMRRLIALGVDGIITDHPALARGLLP